MLNALRKPIHGVICAKVKSRNDNRFIKDATKGTEGHFKYELAEVSVPHIEAFNNSEVQCFGRPLH